MAIKRVKKTIVQREGGDTIFGEGTDGSATFDGTTTVLSLVPASSVYKLVKDIYCTNLTVNNGVTLFTNGFRIFVNGTFTNNGTVGMPVGISHSKSPISTYGIVNENQTLTLTAPAGSVFTAILFMSYGTPTGIDGVYAINNACHATLTDAQKLALLGQNTLSVAATNALFTDPCSGTAKQLAIVAEYSPADGSGTIASRNNVLNPTSAWGTSSSPILVSDLYDLDDAVSGWFITGAGTITQIKGGSLGATGSNGNVTAATGPFAGAAGNYPGATVGQAGGQGNPGTAGTAATAGIGGAGGLGGGLIIVFAKTVAGSGTIVSQGFAGRAGTTAIQGSAGSAGNPAPNITGYHTSGTYHHTAGSTGPNPGAGTAHPSGHNAGTHPTTHHHPAGSHGPNPGAGTPHPSGHHSGYYHHPANGHDAFSPHHATVYPAGHNPGNPHAAGHNSGTGYHHHPAGNTHGSHASNGPRNFTNHNATVSGKNHNAGHGYHHHGSGTPHGHHPAGGPHNAFSHHNGTYHGAGHNSTYHPSGHNAGNHNHPANAPHSGKGHHHATVYNASHNAGTHPTTHHHPAGSTGPNPGAGTAHPSGHNSGTHPHTAATLNVTTGAVTSNRSAAPSHSAPTLNYSGGAGGAAGAAGTANPGATGATGSTGGIVVVTRNAGNVASQIGHSNYSKVIDI